MKRTFSCILALSVVATLSFGCQTGPKPTDEITLPAIFSDNMVLQRDQPIPVWGTGSPGDQIRVELNGSSNETSCDEGGGWRRAETNL
ncbi:MAG: hypothetical protein JSU96_11485 [Acidobacteriota bacterium]|nr:MAG: hypothetical protein JSU96_11485 [Acidobacteriota bacterium]